MLLDSLFNNKNNSKLTYAKMLDGSFPVFSQFGNNIYASDIVQMCIDRIATEISKLQPKHIRTDKNGIQSIPPDSINRLFRFAPNPLMTTRDFLEKMIWILYFNYNAFIYPTYDKLSNGLIDYTGFYPLNPIQVDFLQDNTGKLFAKMYFQGGNNFTLPYSDIVHLRKKFSVNDIMGGGRNGQPDNAPLLKAIEINDTITQGLGKAIKSSLTIRGILKVNTILDDEKQQAERKRFESNINNNESGILPMDLKGEYVPLTTDPKLIDKDTMEFIQNKILYWYGVPLKILAGSYTDEEYQAFYENTLEGLIISLGQAFSKTMFTQNQLDFGNEIVFYQRDMMYLSTANKLRLLEVAGGQGLLKDDQKLAILGYPPKSDGTGNRITMSLNYISADIADQYQMNKAKMTNNKTDDGGTK
jgi:HK97 family phage portal protein